MTKKRASSFIFRNPHAFEEERKARLRLRNNWSIEVEDIAKVEAEVKVRIASRIKAIEARKAEIREINNKIEARKEALAKRAALSAQKN